MNNKSNLWGVPQEILKKAYQKSSSYVIIKLTLLFLIWFFFSCCILKTHSLVLKIFLWVFLGYFINGLVQLVHDSWHHTLFPKRWQNRLIGHTLSFLFFVLYHPPRHGHLLHHRYNRTERDPDAYNTGKKSWDLLFFYYGVFLVGVPLAVIHFNLLYPLQFYNRNQLNKHFIQLSLLIFLQALIWSLLFITQLNALAYQVWLMPILFTSLWNGMKSVADHFENDWQGSALKSATTVTSNPLTTFFWNGLNYHLEHHLFPGVPGYNLPQLHVHLKPLFQQHRSSIFSSYYHLWWRALIRGPEVVQRERKFNPFNFKNENKL